MKQKEVPEAGIPRMMGGLGQGRGQREEEEEANVFVDSKSYQISRVTLRGKI